MIGAIIGDIVGSRFEFNRTNDPNFVLFTPQCDFTDDTICTIAIADAIMNRNDNFRDALVYWCSRYNHPMGGYGGRFAQWINNPIPYDSFGNGAAMRVSPVAWLNNNLSMVLDAAWLQSAVSHDHPEGIRGAKAVAYATYMSRMAWYNGKPTTMKQIVDDTLRRFEYPPTCDIEWYKNKFFETMPETIDVAFWVLRISSDFESAIRNAIAIGGDADTLGAIVGSIAGAFYGVPRHLYDRALDYLPDDMIAIVEQFNIYTNGQNVY